MATELCNLLSVLTGVVLGAFLSWFLNVVITSLVYKPKISIEFGAGKPCLMYRRYFRLKVMNKGRTIARSCIAKFSFTEANADKWREKELLHWVRYDPQIFGHELKGISAERIYKPIDIAKNDYELLDVFFLEKRYQFAGIPILNTSTRQAQLILYSFPSFEHSMSPKPKISTNALDDRYKIREGIPYKGKVSVYCDNSDPQEFIFYFKFENETLYIGMDTKRLEPVLECSGT